MSKLIKITLSSAALVAGLMLSSLPSSAKPDYMKKEKKTCTHCHSLAGKKELNEVGKCYAEHGHTLDTCGPKKIT